MKVQVGRNKLVVLREVLGAGMVIGIILLLPIAGVFFTASAILKGARNLIRRLR